MPESDKSLKKKEQAKNRALGLGDENGRLPSRVKAAEVNVKCTICSTEIRMTKTNTEAKQHYESKHPTSTFAICFPGQFDPTIVVAATTSSAPIPTSSSTVAPAAPAKKKAAKADLSFLDASINPKK